MNQDASTTVFTRPRGLLESQGIRLATDISLFGQSVAMEDILLKKPIKALNAKIFSTERHKTTRATTEELRTGNDLSLASSYISALHVIDVAHDDIELIHYGIINKDTGKLWYSSSIFEDGMLSRAIKAVLANSDNDKIPIPETFTDTEFLGFAEVYRDRRHNIMAFNITAMLLFRNDKGMVGDEDGTLIESAIVARDMGNSSILERLIQCLQVLQMQRSKISVEKQQLTIKTPWIQHDRALDPNYSNYQAPIAYLKGGFKQYRIDRSDEDNLMRTLCSDGVVLHMAQYTWKIAWLKHYNAISPVPRNIGGKDKRSFYKSIVQKIINALSKQPTNHIWKSTTREHLTRIEDYIVATRNRLLQYDPQSSHDDIIEPLARTVLPGIMTLVA